VVSVERIPETAEAESSNGEANGDNPASEM
jgi:hypothetical protein